MIVSEIPNRTNSFFLHLFVLVCFIVLLSPGLAYGRDGNTESDAYLKQGRSKLRDVINARTGMDATRKETRVDVLFKDYQGDGVPGAAVMIISHGKPLLKKCYGMADIEHKTPVTSCTNFRLASVTKQFTAMCVMILAERGKIDYSDTLAQIFPDFPPYANKITIRHILQHTSGLKPYEDLIPTTATEQVKDRDVLRMMKQQEETLFEPGADYKYSNTGYALLAMIIEKASGKSFAGFLEQEIFKPLGMENTVAFEHGASIVPHRAFGYSMDKGTVKFSDQSMTSAVLGDGGIYSSIDDLYKWDQALYTEKIVGRESLDMAFTPWRENYGFGWRIDQYKGRRRIHHTGSTSGFRTVFHRFPDDAFSVIILTNRSEPNVAPLAEKLVDMYLLNRKGVSP